MASISLGDSVDIPQLGFGVFQVPPEETKQAVLNALEAGYRHIDTARIYDNEAAVGAAISDFGIDHDDLFVTTKLWNDDHGRASAPAALDASLRRLGLDYVDLYLIHWPCPKRDLFVETWEAMLDLAQQGKTRVAGVSNFRIADLSRLQSEGLDRPAINQVELHPQMAQQELRAYHDERGIVTEAWSPLGQARILDTPRLRELAEAHDATPAQVVIAWHLAIGNVTIPKSVTPARVKENFASTNVSLTQDEVDSISALDRNQRIGPDPTDVN